MGTKYRPKAWDEEKIPYDSYDYDCYEFDMDDNPVGTRKLSRDFYNTEWEKRSGSDRRFSSRRKIERRKDLKKTFPGFVDWDDSDQSNESDLKNDW